MLKIGFFSPEIIKYYEDKIADEVKRRNGGNDEIIFIPPQGALTNTGDPYKISLKELLTSERDDVLKIEGIKLYMLICSAQKYKSKSNARLLNTLKSAVYKVIISGRKYELNGIIYLPKGKNDNSSHSIIGEVAKLVKAEFSNYSKDYADSYFDHYIASVDELNVVLDEMFNDAKNLLNGTQGSFIEYSMIPNDLRHKLMSSLEIRTCPYCNRNYITIYGKGKRSTADLDHFYQKKQYPLFALSLFNFIPSCQICNSRMKNTHSAENTLYPYKEGFEKDAHFELKYTGKNKTGADILYLWQAIKDIEYSDYNIEIVIDSATSPEKKRGLETAKNFFISRKYMRIISRKRWKQLFVHVFTVKGHIKSSAKNSLINARIRE